MNCSSSNVYQNNNMSASFIQQRGVSPKELDAHGIEGLKQPNEDDEEEDLPVNELEAQLMKYATDLRESRDCKCPSILIVEDDEFIRIVTKTIITQLGFEVKDVWNGQLAVNALREQSERCDRCKGILIVLMDYDMPIMNGVEVSSKC